MILIPEHSALHLTVVDAKVVRPANAKSFTLEELQRLVGGYIELVAVPSVLELVLVVDEEGLLKELLPNELASQFAQREIRGPALVCRRGLIE